MREQPRAVVVKTLEEWVRQAEEGMAQIERKNGGVLPEAMRDGYEIDREAFSRVIEALYALAENGAGAMPDEELQRLAGLKPVDQVLELP